MWGICLDIFVCNGNLYQRAIEYENALSEVTAHTLQPIRGIEISADQIKPVEKPPVFIYGELVSPVKHSDIIGKITDIIWHFKNYEYNYYISVNGKKKSKRYYSDDLFKVEEII